jgi:hypothetical protein
MRCSDIRRLVSNVLSFTICSFRDIREECLGPELGAKIYGTVRGYKVESRRTRTFTVLSMPLTERIGSEGCCSISTDSSIGRTVRNHGMHTTLTTLPSPSCMSNSLPVVLSHMKKLPVGAVSASKRRLTYPATNHRPSPKPRIHPAAQQS